MYPTEEDNSAISCDVYEFKYGRSGENAVSYIIRTYHKPGT